MDPKVAALREAPFDQISADDPRIAAVGRGVPVGLRQLTIADLAALGPAGPAGLTELLEQHAEALAVWAQRLNQDTLEAGVAELADALESERHGPRGTRRRPAQPLTDVWRKAIHARLGLTGESPVTLEEAGAAAGVTRERVRQVEAQLHAALPSRPLHLPALDRAYRVLTDRDLLSVDAVSQCLHGAGLATGHWEPAGLNALLQLAAREERLVVHDGFLGRQAHLVPAIRSKARRMAGALGVVSVESLAKRLVTDHPEVGPELVEAVLLATEGIEMLGEGWFWSRLVPEGRNRLANTAEKMLAVASPLSHEVIAEGQRRVLRGRMVHEPVSDTAVAGFLRAHDAFIVDEFGVRLRQPADWRETHGEEIRHLIEVLQETPYHVMDRVTLVQSCTDRGMSGGTVSTYLSFHEVISSYGHNVWGLVGAKVPESVIREMQHEAYATREPMHYEEGWTAEGRPWRRFRATRSFLQTAVLLRPWLEVTEGQRFQAVDQGGTKCGVLAVGEGHGLMWGFRGYLAGHDVPHGALMYVEVDLATGMALLRHEAADSGAKEAT